MDVLNELSLSEIRKKIIEYNNNINIQEYYKQKSYLEILGIARRENSHSSFLTWFLNPNESHGLFDFGLRRLLEVIITNKFLNILNLESELIDIITTGQYNIFLNEIINEYSINNKDRIDIFIDFVIENNSFKKNITIIIENKVSSLENDNQTDKYFNYFKDKIIDNSHIFLYLSPISNSELNALLEPQCKNKNFMPINYQALLDNLFQPAMGLNLNSYTKSILEQYIKSLHRPELDSEIGNNKRGYIMAYDQEQRDLLKKFWEANEVIILAAVDILRKDPETEKEQQELFENIYKTINIKNKSPQLNFVEIGIPIGSEISFKNDINKKAIIISNKTVKYNGEEYSLSQLSKILLKTDGSIRGTDYWNYNGKTLRHYYDKKYKI